MRVAYIRLSPIPSLRANSIHVMKMCQALQQEGYDTTLLLPETRSLTSTTAVDLWHHYGISTPFAIQKVKAMPGLRGHGFYVQAAWWARSHAFEWVYTRDLGAAAWTSLFGLSTIFEAHALPTGKAVPLYAEMLRRGRGFRRLVVISRPLRALFLQQHGDWLRQERTNAAGADLVLAPDGVDLDRFEGLPLPTEARDRLQLPPGQFTAGYAGHLYAGRGIELIMWLAQRLPRARFLIMGGTDDAVAEYREKATRLAHGNIQFVGFVPNAELPLYLAACDVLLMPYQRQVATSGGRTNTVDWMSPMKMFEYMAASRLIISSDLPVLREVLNEDNAALCDPEDAGAWQRAIERAMQDVDRRRCLAQKAREDVEQYTWRRRVRHILPVQRRPKG